MNEAYREFSGRPAGPCHGQSGLAGPEVVVEMTFIASSAPRRGDRHAAAGDPHQSRDPRRPASVPLGRAGQYAGDGGRRRGADARDAGAIGNTLEAAGASPADVVEGLVYLTDGVSFGGHERRYRALLRRRISRPAPPW